MVSNRLILEPIPDNLRSLKIPVIRQAAKIRQPGILFSIQSKWCDSLRICRIISVLVLISLILRIKHRVRTHQLNMVVCFILHQTKQRAIRIPFLICYPKLGSVDISITIVSLIRNFVFPVLKKWLLFTEFCWAKGNKIFRFIAVQAVSRPVVYIRTCRPVDKIVVFRRVINCLRRPRHTCINLCAHINITSCPVYPVLGLPDKQFRASIRACRHGSPVTYDIIRPVSAILFCHRV